MTSTVLSGLAPTPLSGYLAALGLFRLLAEQRDPTVTAAWVRDEFVVEGLTLDEIVEFFVDHYVPTPIFSPWNKEGNPRENDTTRTLLDTIATADNPRFDAYRRTLDAWTGIEQSDGWQSGEKGEQIAVWRAAAPDDALGWLDAAVALSSDGPKYPPLYGSGGNDGRFEFSRLLYGELVRVFVDPKKSRDSAGWLRSLLTAVAGPALVESTLGMFDADAAGTANSAPDGSAQSASNPWAIVLTFEGLIAMGASIASRAGSAHQQFVAAPFTVRVSPVAHNSSTTEGTRGEFWAPLWTRPARWSELKRVIAEGRMSWNGRQAASTVDAARAVATLAVDRGIHSFVRHQIVQRNGKSFVATAVGRMRVRPVDGVAALGAVDRWLSTARRSPGSSTRRAVVEVDRALFAAASTASPGAGSAKAGSTEAFQEVLVSIARLEAVVGSSTHGRETCPPFPNRAGAHARLDARSWWPLVDDDTPETRLAMALASLRSYDRSLPFASAALALRGLTGSPGSPRWPNLETDRDPAAVAVRRAGDLAPVEVLKRRIQAAAQRDTFEHGDSSDDAFVSVPRVGYPIGRFARLDDVVDLLNGHLDTARILRLSRGFSLLDTDRRSPPRNDDRAAVVAADDDSWSRSDRTDVAIDPWFAAVRLCVADATFGDDEARRREGRGALAGLPTTPRHWGRSLDAERFADMGTEALTLLARQDRTSLRRAQPPAGGAVAVAVALLVRLPHSTHERFLRELADPVPQETTQ